MAVKIEGLPFLQKNPFICICTAGRERTFGGKIPNNRQSEAAENPLAGRAEFTTFFAYTQEIELKIRNLKFKIVFFVQKDQK